MPLTVIQNDITKEKAHVIVNAANKDLAIGGGVCGAIFKKAGRLSLSLLCSQLAPIEVGGAIATSGICFGRGGIIVHAVGPVYIDGKHREAEMLKQTYTNALLASTGETYYELEYTDEKMSFRKIALFALIYFGILRFPKKGDKYFDMLTKGVAAVETKFSEYSSSSPRLIALPLISAGTFRYPKEEAIKIAVETIQDFLLENSDKHYEISLVLKDRESFRISKRLCEGSGIRHINIRTNNTYKHMYRKDNCDG